MRQTNQKARRSASVKRVVKELTKTLDSYRIATLERRLCGLRTVRAEERDRDTDNQAVQRTCTIRCVELKLQRLAARRDGGRHRCRRTLDRQTLLCMLGHLLDRCSAELGELGKDNCLASGRVLALWRQGADLLADSNRVLGEVKEVQPEPFIKKEALAAPHSTVLRGRDRPETTVTEAQ